MRFNRGHRSRLKRIKKKEEEKEMNPTNFSTLVHNLKKKEEKFPGCGQGSSTWERTIERIMGPANGNINAIPVPVVNESKPRVRLRSEE